MAKTKHPNRSSAIPWAIVAAVAILSILFAVWYPGTKTVSQPKNRSNRESRSKKRKLVEPKSNAPPPPPAKEPATVFTVINKSTFRADIYWEGGDRFGTLMATVEIGESHSFNAHPGNEFYVTRHGVREMLFDAENQQVTYTFDPLKGDDFVIPENAAPSKNPCLDRYSVCKEEAARGSCWSSPGWMIVHCCQSCDPHLQSAKLIDPKVRCSNAHLNITAPAWEKGDLQRLFASWATEEEFKGYTPVVLSSPGGEFGGQDGPWVLTFDTFFDAAEAEALIRGGQMVGFEGSTNQGNTNELGEKEKVVSTTRTSQNAWCIGACEEIPEIDAITARIERVTHIHRKHYENFQILKYQHHQFYRSHHDTAARDTSPAGPRIMTFFLYLTDVEEGGETYFNQLGFGVKPKRGRALVWPSVSDDDPTYWDRRMYHEAQDVIKGQKYAANHWIHLNDFVGPNKWGCTGSFS